MNTIELKTNIHCMKCVEKISEFLNPEPGIETWSVDIDDPDKTLKIQGEISRDQVISLIQKAGYDIIDR